MDGPSRCRVVVAVRVRPFNKKEKSEGEPTCFPAPPLSPSAAAAADETLSESLMVSDPDPTRPLPSSVPATGNQGSATPPSAPLAPMQTVANTTRHKFSFNHVFWSMRPHQQHGFEAATQADVYSQLGPPIVNHSLDGFNACLFAYGQTGSGKTHSMIGPASAVPSKAPAPTAASADASPDDEAEDSCDDDDDNASSSASPNRAESDDSPAGLIPRLGADIFARIGEMQTDTERYAVTCSFAEVYCEKVRDLLPKQGSSPHAELKVRQHPVTGPFVEGLTTRPIKSMAELMKLLSQGMHHRATAETKMNERSSRSHAIFTVTIAKVTLAASNATSGDVTTRTRTSKMNLVDLAGSERVSQSGAAGDRLEEAKKINVSLHTLGRVITSLAERQRAGGTSSLVPYRDSVLTWLLSDSLGGNSKTTMLATVSPTRSALTQTLNTLRFASLALNIVNTVAANESRSDSEIILDLRDRIARLTLQIENSEATTVAKREMSDVRSQLNAANRRIRELEAQNMALKADAGRAESDRKKLEETKKELTKVQTAKAVVDQQLNHVQMQHSREAERLRVDGERHAAAVLSLRRELDDAKDKLQNQAIELHRRPTRGEVKDAIEQETSGLQAQLDEAESVTASLKAELREATAHHDAAERSRAEMARDLEDKVRQNTLLQQQLSTTCTSMIASPIAARMLHNTDGEHTAPDALTATLPPGQAAAFFNHAGSLGGSGIEGQESFTLQGSLAEVREKADASWEQDAQTRRRMRQGRHGTPPDLALQNPVAENSDGAIPVLPPNQRPVANDIDDGDVVPQGDAQVRAALVQCRLELVRARAAANESSNDAASATEQAHVLEVGAFERSEESVRSALSDAMGRSLMRHMSKWAVQPALAASRLAIERVGITERSERAALQRDQLAEYVAHLVAFNELAIASTVADAIEARGNEEFWEMEATKAAQQRAQAIDLRERHEHAHADAVTQLDSALAQLEALRHEMAVMRKEREEFEDAATSDALALSERADDAMGLVAKAENHAARLQRDLDASVKKVQELTDTLDNMQGRRLADDANQSSEMSELRERLRGEVFDAKAEALAVEERLAAVEARCEHLKREAKEAEVAKARGEAEGLALKSELERRDSHMIQQATEHRKDIELLEHRIAVLEHEFQEMREVHDMEVRDLEETHDRRQRDRDSERDSLQSELADVRRRYADADEDRVTLRFNLNEEGKRRSELESELRSANLTRAKYMRRAETLDAKVAELADRNAELEEVARMETQRAVAIGRAGAFSPSGWIDGLGTPGSQGALTPTPGGPEDALFASESFHGGRPSGRALFRSQSRASDMSGSMPMSPVGRDLAARSRKVRAITERQLKAASELRHEMRRESLTAHTSAMRPSRTSQVGRGAYPLDSAPLFDDAPPEESASRPPLARRITQGPSLSVAGVTPAARRIDPASSSAFTDLKATTGRGSGISPQPRAPGDTSPVPAGGAPHEYVDGFVAFAETDDADDDEVVSSTNVTAPKSLGLFSPESNETTSMSRAHDAPPKDDAASTGTATPLGSLPPAPPAAAAGADGGSGSAPSSFADLTTVPGASAFSAFAFRTTPVSKRPGGSHGGMLGAMVHGMTPTRLQLADPEDKETSSSPP